jgi:hypothetical protein
LAAVGQKGCVSLAQWPLYLFVGYGIFGAKRVAISVDLATGEKKAMADLTLAELDERIAAIRQNISDLVEQAAAYSGAGDESRTADRIAQQEQELARLNELRAALLRSQ